MSERCESTPQEHRTHDPHLGLDDGKSSRERSTQMNNSKISTNIIKEQEEPSLLLNGFCFPQRRDHEPLPLMRRHSDVVKPCISFRSDNTTNCQMPIKRRLSNAVQPPMIVHTQNLIANHSTQPWMDVINLLSDQLISTPIEKACLSCTIPVTTFGNQIHQRICQFVLDNEKTKEKMHLQIEEYKRQLSVSKNDMEGCIKENIHLKHKVKQLDEELKMLRLEMEKSKLEYKQHLTLCEQHLLQKEDDIQTLCTFSEKLQIENEVLSKVQQIMSKELESLVSQLKTQKEQSACLRNISEMLHALVEEKDRVINEQTEWINAKLLEMQSKWCSGQYIQARTTTSTSHLMKYNNDEGMDRSDNPYLILQNMISQVVEDFKQEFTLSLNISPTCHKTESNSSQNDTGTFQYEQKLESLGEELKMLNEKNENSETSLKKSHETILHDINSKMSEISQLRHGFSQL